MKRGHTKEERNAYMREWTRRNPEKVKAASAKTYQKNKIKRREQIDAALADRREFVTNLKRNPCLDCGGSFHPAAMDFDHVSGEKIACVTNLVKGSSMEKIKAEIEKCELVCSNCHRVRTHKRR